MKIAKSSFNALTRLFALTLLLSIPQAHAWKVFKENPFKNPPHAWKKVEELGKSVADGVDKVGDQWNRFREEKIDPIGDVIELTVDSLVKGGTVEFPPRFEDHRMPEVKNPTLKFAISSAVLNDILRQYVKDDIPLDDRATTGVATNNYIHISSAKLEFDEGKNVIHLRIGSGRLGLVAVKANVGLSIKDAEIELAPVLRVTDKKIYLDMWARLVYLDLENNMPWFDRSVAQAVQRVSLGKKPIVTIDLIESLRLSLPVINTKRSVTSEVTGFSLSIRSGWIEVIASTTAMDN